MKTLISAAAVGTVLRAATADVQAVEPGHFYLEGESGAVFQQDLNIKSAVSPGAGRIEFDPGFRFGLAAGYQMSEAFSMQIETGFLWNNISKIGGGNPSEDSDLWQIPMLADLVYRVPVSGRWSPYIGGGVGAVASVLDLHTSLGEISTEDFTFAYQAFVGVKYRVSSKIDVGLTYKFLGSLDHSWKDNNLTFKTDGTLNHTVLASFTWKF